MLFDFDVYLIDELTAVGDLNFRDKARAVFQSKRDRASFIKCTHNLQELAGECDAGILLQDGILTYYKDIKEAIHAYLGTVTRSRIRTRQEERLAKDRRNVDTPTDEENETEHPRVKRRARRRQQSAAKRPHKPAPMAPRLPPLGKRVSL